MPIHLSSQQPLAGLPACSVRLAFDMPLSGREIFPPTGFLYINIYRNRPPARQADGAQPRRDFVLSVHIEGADQAALHPCRMILGGLLSRGPALMDGSGVGEVAILTLHPVAAYHFLEETLDRVSDAFVPLAHIIGPGGDSLRPQIEDSHVFGWEEEALTRFVHQRIAEKKQHWCRDPIFGAVNRIIACKGLIRVKELAREVCMSLRNFERQFLLKVGVKPKTYINIWRFQTAMQLLQSHPRRSLGDVVHEAGYYDIPHFLKDLKKKTGEGYEAYLKKIPDLTSAFLHSVRDQKVVAFLQ